jgi:hypothetical protein
MPAPFFCELPDVPRRDGAAFATKPGRHACGPGGPRGRGAAARLSTCALPHDERGDDEHGEESSQGREEEGRQKAVSTPSR